MAVPWLLEERAAGAQIACVYLTDGGGHGVDPAVRDAESRAALRTLGIRDDAVVMLAAPNGRIGDGQLALRSLEALAAVEMWIERSEFAPQRVYAPSYEGGHPDHDAAHLLASVVAVERGIAGDAWHFSLYNAYRRPRPFFATMRQLPTSSTSRRAAMSPATRWRATWLCGSLSLAAAHVAGTSPRCRVRASHRAPRARRSFRPRSSGKASARGRTPLRADVRDEFRSVRNADARPARASAPQTAKTGRVLGFTQFLSSSTGWFDGPSLMKCDGGYLHGIFWKARGFCEKSKASVSPLARWSV